MKDRGFDSSAQHFHRREVTGHQKKESEDKGGPTYERWNDRTTGAEKNLKLQDQQVLGSI